MQYILYNVYCMVKCLMFDYALFATRMKDEIIVVKSGRFVVQQHFQLKRKIINNLVYMSN